MLYFYMYINRKKLCHVYFLLYFSQLTVIKILGGCRITILHLESQITQPYIFINIYIHFLMCIQFLVFSAK
jgi:hypothetical protein